MVVQLNLNSFPRKEEHDGKTSGKLRKREKDGKKESEKPIIAG